MMKINDKGIGAVKLLAALLIVCLVAGAGWFVWDKNNSAKLASEANSATKIKAKDNIKPGNYSSTELGVNLSYPEKWGEATLADGPLLKFQSGSYKQLSFSKAPSITMNFVTGVYSSPLDACGYDDPVLNAQHGLNAKRASVIGWENAKIKRYMTGQNIKGAVVVIEEMKPGVTGAGWTEITKDDKVLVYKDIDKPENRVKAGDGGECGPVSQAEADAANAYFSYYHYALNYSNAKVLGVNAQFDVRQGDDAAMRQTLVKTLNSIR